MTFARLLRNSRSCKIALLTFGQNVGHPLDSSDLKFPNDFILVVYGIGILRKGAILFGNPKPF